MTHSRDESPESEHHYRLLYEHAPISCQSLDENGIILDVNVAWLKTLGYERDEVIGRKFTDFLTPESAERVRLEFPVFKMMGEIHNVEFEIIRKNRTRCFVKYEGRIVTDAAGRFRQTHCIFTDISERKKVEEELKKMYLRVRKYARQKDDLLNEVNHRVKNNLMTILGLILIEKKRTAVSDPTVAQSLWEEFELKIHALLKVNQLLSDSRWGPLNISTLSQPILQGVLAIYEPGTDVVLNVVPSEIVVTPRQANNIALVLNELMTNSIKHAFSETTNPSIYLHFWTEDRIVCIEYGDNGIGYPADVLTHRRENVGLHLVRQLVQETLGGTMKMFNRSGAVMQLTIRAEGVSGL